MTGDDLLPDALAFTLGLVADVGTRLAEIFRGTAPLRHERKRDGSLLTDADLEANERILGAIRARFPAHGILTEEGGTTAPAESFSWIVDPLDGTTNFAAGIPIWGISIALARDGDPEMGVVAFPILGRVYHAVRGAGAYLDGAPIATRRAAGRGIFVTCTNALARYHFDLEARLRVLGSATWNLIMVAEGRAAGGMEARPKIWDVAAGQLIIEESGGAVSFPAGGRFFPFSAGTDYRDVSCPMITAADREALASLQRGIRPR